MIKPWALITGGAKRIGRVIALDLARAGWNIIVHYSTSESEAAELVEEIQILGSKACAAKADLMQQRELNELMPALSAEFKPFTLLVNNASLFEKDESDPQGKRHMAINYDAPRLLSEAFHQIDTSGISKVIVNILDSDPTKPQFSFYNKSKIALKNLTLDNALRFAPQTCVHGIALGAILRNPRESAEHFQALIDKSPLKISPSPQDIARSIRFFTEMPTITGNVLSLDGGLHLLSSVTKES